MMHVQAFVASMFRWVQETLIDVNKAKGKAFGKRHKYKNDQDPGNKDKFSPRAVQAGASTRA